MKTKIQTILICILAILLVVSNCYHFSRAEKQDWEISVGIPTATGDGVNFTGSDLLKKGQARSVLLAMLTSDHVEEPDISDQPSGVMLIQLPEEGISYFVNLWKQEDRVIFCFQHQEHTEYREISNPQYLPQVQEILDTYCKG